MQKILRLHIVVTHVVWFRRWVLLETSGSVDSCTEIALPDVYVCLIVCVCVCVCDLETSTVRWSRPDLGCSTTENMTLQ